MGHIVDASEMSEKQTHWLTGSLLKKHEPNLLRSFWLEIHWYYMVNCDRCKFPNPSIGYIDIST